MRSTFDGESGDLCTKICACVAAVFIAAAVIGCALRLADKLRPKTGDMISFDPASGIVNATRSPITAVKVGSLPAISCTLEPRVMQASGGSLMIESTQLKPDFSYHVHWAGVRTSDDAADCGISADLLLSAADLSTLALAAGGWK